MDVRAYFPVLMLMGFVILNAILMLGLSHLTMRSRPTSHDGARPSRWAKASCT